MRSSPSSLVENRSGGNGEWRPDEPDPKGSDKSVTIRRFERPPPDDGAEVTVHLKVGYKNRSPCGRGLRPCSSECEGADKHYLVREFIRTRNCDCQFAVKHVRVPQGTSLHGG